MTSTTGSRTASDGTRLATRRWSNEEPRAVVVLIHGLGEHSGRYEHVGDELARRGFEVRSTDLRGFGRSEGESAYVDDFSQYVGDQAADITSARSVNVPVVLLGHSMGGLIALLYAMSRHPQPDLLVLSAPAIDASLPRAKVAVARLLARVFPKLKVSNGLKGEQLSRDPAVGEKYFTDPHVLTRSTVGLGVALMSAMERARYVLRDLATPALVIHGGQDPLVEPSVSAPLGGLDGVTRIVFDDFRHESFNEEGGGLAIATVADWIDEQLAS